ncbi:CvpA family protein [Chloroflexota bacterium]
MNWVDVVIIAGMLLGAYMGYRHGLIRMAFTFAGLLAGLAIAGQYSDNLAVKLSPSEAQWASILSFILILVVVVIVANLAGKVAKMFFKLMLMGWLDWIGGIVLGVVVGAFAIAAVLTIVLQWQMDQPGLSSVKDAIGDSTLAKLLIDNFRLVLALLPDKYSDVKNIFE